jgi:hypothetical protein
LPHYWRKKATLVKTEVTYGTDPTPTGAANAMIIVNARLSTVGNEVSRDLDQPYMGAQPTLNTGVHREFSGEFEIAGSGAAGTAPKWGPLMRALKHAETITAMTDVKYSPVHTAMESATIYFNVDERRYKLLGFRGKLTGKIAMGEVPRFGFTGKGLFVDCTDTALPLLTLTGWVDPITVSKLNTPTFTVNGVALKMRSFEFDNGGQVNFRELVGQEEVVVTDHAMSGRFDVERPLLSAINFDNLAKNRTKVPIVLEHGGTAGNIVRFDAATAELGWPEGSEFQGIVHDTVPFRAIPTSAGNDDYLITVK